MTASATRWESVSPSVLTVGVDVINRRDNATTQLTLLRAPVSAVVDANTRTAPVRQKPCAFASLHRRVLG
jgi:hypothetical protein